MISQTKDGIIYGKHDSLLFGLYLVVNHKPDYVTIGREFMADKRRSQFQIVNGANQ